MAKFSDILLSPEATKPSRVVVLPPSAFADSWGSKPREDVAVGLRLLSEADLQSARGEASKLISGWFDVDGSELDIESRIDAYNDALVRFAVARGTCDPNDRGLPYFELAEDTVRIALTSEGAARLWDELVKMHVSSGVSFHQADDDDLGELAEILSTGTSIHKLPRGASAEVRKLLAYCLEQLRAVGDENESESAYVAKG